jgi:organic radical activating enzyme
MADIEKTACRYAWTYPIIDMGRGELRNCCRTPFNTIAPDEWSLGTDIFKKLAAIKNVKRDLLTGVKTEKCRTCWTSEDYGIQSPRTGFEDFAKFVKAVKWQNLSIDEVKNKLRNLSPTEIDQLIELEHPEHIELSLSTTCDLKCVYCSHVFSTQWATERLKYGEITQDQVPRNSSDEYEKIWWEWFETTASKTVHKITFVGGEPLINDKFYYYVDRLVDYYDRIDSKIYVHIFVATNFNTPRKYFDKLLEALKKINSSKRVTLGIGLSFESTGKKNEFIRSNANWQVFDRNVFEFISAIKVIDPNRWKVNIVIMPSFNALSISDMPDFIRYVSKIRHHFDRYVRLSTTHVTYPMRYSPFILTPDYNRYIDESINILKQDKFYAELPENEPGSWISFTNYLETIKTAITNSNGAEVRNARNDLIADIHKLAERRGLNVAETFPEMADFFTLCSTQGR